MIGLLRRSRILLRSLARLVDNMDMRDFKTKADARLALKRFVTFVINYYDSLGYDFPGFDGKIVADIRGTSVLARPDYRLLFDKWTFSEALKSAREFKA